MKCYIRLCLPGQEISLFNDCHCLSMLVWTLQLRFFFFHHCDYLLEVCPGKVNPPSKQLS
jgi:hypothetical protein